MRELAYESLFNDGLCRVTVRIVEITIKTDGKVSSVTKRAMGR